MPTEVWRHCSAAELVAPQLGESERAVAEAAEKAQLADARADEMEAHLRREEAALAAEERKAEQGRRSTEQRAAAADARAIAEAAAAGEQRLAVAQAAKVQAAAVAAAMEACKRWRRIADRGGRTYW